MRTTSTERASWVHWLAWAMGVVGCLGGSLVWAEDWPQWLGPKRDGVWREAGVVERWPSAGLSVRWRTPVAAGYAGPAVSRGRVFVVDRVLGAGARNPDDPFGRGEIPGQERVHCVEESTGKILWTHAYDAAYTMSYPAGPRATPLVDGDQVYTLGGEGQLRCLEVATGRVVWAKDLNEAYGVKTPLWGYAGHPLVDGDRLICLAGGEGSVVVALNKRTGQEMWRALTAKEPGYAPPVIYELAGRRQLVVWHPESVNGLDPETGRVWWSHPWVIRVGLSVAMPRADGDRLFLTAFYNGSLMLRVKGEGSSEVVYQSPKISEKDTLMLHSIMPTPHLVGDYVYGVCSYGQLRCLRNLTGERVWESYEPIAGASVRWGNAFLVRQGETDRFWIFNERGELILARLTPSGYGELGRMRVVEPTNEDPRRAVVWSHPAFANRCVFIRNDRELVSVDASSH